MGYVIYVQFKQHKQLPSGIEDGHPNNLKMDVYNHLYKSIYGGFEGMVLDVDDLSTAILTAGRFFCVLPVAGRDAPIANSLWMKCQLGQLF